MARILSIQPDSAQSAALRQALGPADADIVVVASIDDALTAIDSQLPDLVLLDTFVPPGDADDLVAHLRILPDADHVQVINVPLIQPAPARTEFVSNRRRRAWPLHWFLEEPRRSKTSPVAWDPQAFAADVAAYLSHSGTLRSAHEQQKSHDQQPGILERRRAERRSPLELSLPSSVRLATTAAGLINLSSGGALVRCESRPKSSVRSQFTLTLSLPSGEQVHQIGRPIRCHVRSAGHERFLYDVAFQFDESLSFGLTTRAGGTSATS
jgi:CheY-like chemotaxis protein